MHAWQRRRIDLTKLLKNDCGILFQMLINAKPISANVTTLTVVGLMAW
jgi:hypothetical protein